MSSKLERWGFFMSSKLNKVLIADYDMITPYGIGIENCWNGLLSNKTVIKSLDRINTEHFIAKNGAVIPDIDLDCDESLIIQMLEKLLDNKKLKIKDNFSLFLATTTGEIDLLEKDVLAGKSNSHRSNLKFLLEKVEKKLGSKRNSGILVSAACASATVALAKAGMMISSGKIDCAVIVACDCLSEFVFSGFSALMALSPEIAKPFDKNRSGLSLGEAAGYIVLVNEERAQKDNISVSGEIVGWGLSSDAYHMTGPSPDGKGLSCAIRAALNKADLKAESISSISAHGTGTLYNDSMEINAFKDVFDKVVPAYSIKGGIGHTLGAAGLIETILAVKNLETGIIPPTVGFSEASDDSCEGWISTEKRVIINNYILKVNAGFGGINAALILKHC